MKRSVLFGLMFSVLLLVFGISNNLQASDTDLHIIEMLKVAQFFPSGRYVRTLDAVDFLFDKNWVVQEVDGNMALIRFSGLFPAHQYEGWRGTNAFVGLYFLFNITTQDFVVVKVVMGMFCNNSDYNNSTAFSDRQSVGHIVTSLLDNVVSSDMNKVWSTMDDRCIMEGKTNR